MINASTIIKELSDYDKNLINSALEWAIKNCHLYTAGKADETRTRSNTTLAKLKFEAENYTFPKEEINALNKALTFFHSELISHNISPYDEDEEALEKMHISLKKIDRQLEVLYFPDDYQSS